jgi:hypothetical protein
VLIMVLAVVKNIGIGGERYARDAPSTPGRAAAGPSPSETDGG